MKNFKVTHAIIYSAATWRAMVETSEGAERRNNFSEATETNFASEADVMTMISSNVWALSEMM